MSNLIERNANVTTFRDAVFGIVKFECLSEGESSVKCPHGRNQLLQSRLNDEVRARNLQRGAAADHFGLEFVRHATVFVDEEFEVGEGVGSGCVECVQDEAVHEHGLHPAVELRGRRTSRRVAV